MRIHVVAFIALLCAGLALPSRAATIANSLDDWATDGVQGENGWFYGWYNYTADDDQVFQPGDFMPFLNDGSLEVFEDETNHWDGAGWRLYRDTAATAGTETGPWTSITQDSGHPNGENSAAPLLVDEPEIAEHWAVRRWVSDYDGLASLTSNLAAQNTACGNGTSVLLFHNGQLVDSLSTAAASGVTNTVGRTLATGDILDFALSPVGADGARHDGCDGSLWSLVVSDDPPPPPPVPPLADSLDDWSTTGTQGERGWFNGYYNRTLDQLDADGVYQANDFIPFTNSAGAAGGPVDPEGNHWNGTAYDLTADGGPWTTLGAGATHPNGTNSAPNDEHWTVRRWVADDLEAPTALELTWLMQKTNLNADGVTGKLFVNGEEVDSATIAGNDGVGVERKFYVNANPGDVIDLALTPQGLTNDGDGSDGSFNRLTVRDELPSGPLFNPGNVVADSIAEFSENQGENNWFYGYYDQRVDAEDGDGMYASSDFIPFLNDGSGIVSDDPEFEAWKDGENHWDGGSWDLLENAAPVEHGPWTEVTAGGGHPAANAQGDLEVHWAVRRWVSDVEGDLNISGILNNGSTAGDGTVGRIFVDGQEVWSATSNGTSVPVDVNVTLAQGSIVDFAIDPDGAGNYDPADPMTVNNVQDGNDGTTFSFRIQTINPFTPIGGQLGDFDGDGMLTAADIDALSAAVRAGSTETRFDLNSDGSVNQADRDVWVESPAIGNTYFGDANLDGEFNSSDFVFVFTAGQYEDAIAGNSTWASGDWNGDGDFSSSDFVTAFQAGGYENGPRGAVAAVPEPSSIVLLGSAALLLLGRRRR
jgi:hypothetical protein